MAEPRDIDESLARRVALLSGGGQRWLKIAIQAIRTTEPAPATEHERGEKPPPEREPQPEREPPRLKGASLEDVITGKANLREQLEAYPELSGELEGLGEVIDLLREAGDRRRRRGEDVLRELLEGEGQDEDGEDKPRGRPKRD